METFHFIGFENQIFTQTASIKVSFFYKKLGFSDLINQNNNRNSNQSLDLFLWTFLHVSRCWTTFLTEGCNNFWNEIPFRQLYSQVAYYLNSILMLNQKSDTYCCHFFPFKVLSLSRCLLEAATTQTYSRARLPTNPWGSCITVEAATTQKTICEVAPEAVTTQNNP